MRPKKQQLHKQKQNRQGKKELYAHTLKRVGSEDGSESWKAWGLDPILRHYADVMEEMEAKDGNNVAFTDASYIRHVEMQFLLRNVREQLDYNTYTSLSSTFSKETSTQADSICSSSSGSGSIIIKQTEQFSNMLESVAKKEELDRCIAHMEEVTATRLANGGYVPRIVRLCASYRMTPTESTLFHLMVVVQGSKSPTVLNHLLEYDENRRVVGFQRICRMSEVEVDAFCDAERQHIKEGIVMVEEDQGTHYNLRAPRTAVQLLCGSRVKTDDLLKVAQTVLEDLLESEQGPSPFPRLASSPSPRAKGRELKLGRETDDSTGNDDAHFPLDDMVWDGFKYAPAVVTEESMESSIPPPASSTSLSSSSSAVPAHHRSGAKRTFDDATDAPPSRDEDGAPIKLVRTQSLPIGSASATGVHLDTPGATSLFSFSQLESPTATPDASAATGATTGVTVNNAADSPILGDTDRVDGARSIVQHLQNATRKEYLEYQQLREGSSGAGAGRELKGPRSPRLGPINDRESGDVSSFLPYAPGNQLEYLEDCFQLVALMIRGNSARMKDDMKKEGTRVNHYGEGEVKQGRRELAAKLRLMERKLERRVAVTRDAGVPLPRLEIISERLGLDNFEKRMILLLIGKTVSPLVKALIDTLEQGRIVDDSTNVGQALAILCQDFQTQVANRKYFYRSGRLMTNGIISLNRSRWNQGSGDLTDQRIILDRRLLDWTVGLDSEINELVEGSDLYEPKVELDKVVLPEGVKQMLTSQCLSYEAFLKYRKTSGLEDVITYGNALVLMLCGKSGTGKTMTVNALANKLGKRVLLVDLGNLSAKSQTSSDMDADLRGLFREAAMNNALLFFDECEGIFKSRDHGGDRILNSLLTEIERHEGIVFLATNRPYEMDEAMHRRITAVVDYKAPDSSMRRAIWEGILYGANQKECGSSSSNDNATKTGKGLLLDDDVDLAAIAVKYELTGGFIKNAVMSALLIAMTRDSTAPRLCQDDLMRGCRLQMRGSMASRQSNSDKQFVVATSLSDLLLSSELVAAANTVIRFEKARQRVYGSWTASWSSSAQAQEGTGTSLSQRAAICALAGPSGSGKRTLCRAIATDLGRELQTLHVSDLLNGRSDDAFSLLQAAVHDARLADAVIAIDGFEHVLEDSAGHGESSNKLHLLLGRLLSVLHTFPGCVLLICHMDSPQNVTLQRDFASKLFCFLRMGAPSPELRAKLWKRLLPPLAPIAKDVSFNELGRRFDLNAGGIRNAVARAAAEAAMRGEEATTKASTTIADGTNTNALFDIRQKDLMLAGEAEVRKSRVGNYDLVSKLFA